MENKICTICNKNFYVEKIEDFSKFFHKAKLGKYGFTARCKQCRNKIEVLPNTEKRAEYDRNRRIPKSKTENCIVCGNEFLAQRDEIMCCSKECTKFKKKVYNKLNSEKYVEKIKFKRQKESKLKSNFRKKYTNEEINYIIDRLDKKPSKIANKLNRTESGIYRKIQELKKSKNAN